MLAAFFSVLALAATQSIAAPTIVARQDVAVDAGTSSSESGSSLVASATDVAATGSCGRRPHGHRRPRPSSSASTVVTDAAPSPSATVTETDLEAFPSISDDLSSAEVSPTSFIGDNNNALVTSSAVTSEAEATSSVAEEPEPTSSEAASSSAEAPAPTGTAETGDAFADEILKLHNDFRAQYGAGPLTWSTEAADFAASWAGKCKFDHSGDTRFGENLAAGTGEGFDAAAGFSGWANEASLYDYNNPVFSTGAGHFTQVVWKGTTELGCALVDCPAGSIFDSSYNSVNKFLSCKYKEPGNFRGQFADNVGRKV